jgi:RNA polymerase sigma-70 factor (ECF subfamily)
MEPAPVWPEKDERAAAAAPPPTDAGLVVLTDERGLVERVRRGDRAALGAIFTAYAASLYSYAYRFTRSRAAAEELVHDMFVHIWDVRAEWRVGSLRSYLHSAVRRRALNYLRHRSTEDAWERAESARIEAERPVAESPEDRVLAEDLAAAAARAVEQLTPRCREAYVLHRQHYLSYAEIATVLGVTPKGVEMQIGRALKALRALLAGYLMVIVGIGL